MNTDLPVPPAAQATVTDRHPLYRDGPRWKLIVATIIASLIVLPASLVIGTVVVVSQGRDSACTAVHQSDEALIDFLVERVVTEPNDIVVVRDLAKRLDQVYAEC